MDDVRLYGRSIGCGSHAQVTRGFQEGLTAHGITPHLVAIDDDADDEGPALPGAQAPWALFTGPLNQTPMMARNARHGRRLTMVAPNSDRMPLRLLQHVVSHSTDLMVPSQWARTVVGDLLTEMGLQRPVHVVPHGVSRAFVRRADARVRVSEAYQREEFRVLHLSSSDRERKGTRELIQAWNMAMQHKMLPEKAQLGLVLDVAADMAVKTWLADERVVPHPGIVFSARWEASPVEVSEIFAGVHLVCQPSRGEAFGLVPLEARACGVPVAMTACTGHSEHLELGAPGVLTIPTGARAEIDDLPGAMAPSLYIEHLATSLGRAYMHWRKLELHAAANAHAIQERWSWERKLSTLAAMLKGEAT